MPVSGHTHTHTAISYIDAPVHQLFHWTLIAVVLTECRHSQYERDHDGDPGDPECLLPVALSLVGLQAHAALQQTCTQTQTHTVSDTVHRNRFLCKETSFFYYFCTFIVCELQNYGMWHLLHNRRWRMFLVPIGEYRTWCSVPAWSIFFFNKFQDVHD